MDLAERVRSGVEAIRAGRMADAVEVLAPVVSDAELAAADDLQDVRARVCSLYGQALLDLDRPDEAEGPLREALAIAERLGDEAGAKAVRGLRARAMAATTQRHQQADERRRQERLAATPIEQLLHGVTEPLARADVLLRKATAEADVGAHAEAARHAGQALSIAVEAGAAREEVLARLAIARSQPDRAPQQLLAAWHRAEQAEEFNLVGAVARAAELGGVALPSASYAGRTR